MITGIFQAKAKAEFSAQLTVFNNEKLDKLNIKTLKDANRINYLLKQFAYHISEEIRSKLNGILTHLLLQQHLSKKPQETLASVQKEVHK